MAKLTEEEIRTAGQAAKDAYYEDGYWGWTRNCRSA